MRVPRFLVGLRRVHGLDQRPHGAHVNTARAPSDWVRPVGPAVAAMDGQERLRAKPADPRYADDILESIGKFSLRSDERPGRRDQDEIGADSPFEAPIFRRYDKTRIAARVKTWRARQREARKRPAGGRP